MADLAGQLAKALEPAERLQWAAVHFPKGLEGRYVGTLRTWQFMRQTVVQRFEECKELGRLYYDVSGEIVSASGTARAVSTALCLSKRLLQARAEAALLLGLMLHQHAPEADFQITPEMLRNGTGLSLTRLGRFEDFQLDWVVLGAAKCGTTSLQYNLGLHPDVSLKSTHATTFSHSLLYSSSRFLPLHSIQRAFSSHMPCTLKGHPDMHKSRQSQHSRHGRLKVGCSLVADLAPVYERGTGNVLSSLRDPEAPAEHFLYPFLLESLLVAKPHLKLLYVVRDPVECFLSWNAWRELAPPCFGFANASDCWPSVGHCRTTQAIDLACSLRECSRQNLGVLLAGQTADPVALRAVARLLGADEDFYSKTALRYLNVGKAGRHERRSLCGLRAPVRAQIWRAFREEYGRLAELLGGFQLVEGSREEMLRLFQSWTC